MRTKGIGVSLALLDEFRPGATEATKARIPPESLRACLDPSDGAFVGAEHHHLVPRAIIDELGDDDAHAFFRFSVAHHLRSPHWDWIVRAVDRFFGLDPGRLVRAVPRGFPIVYRDFGRAEVTDVGPQSAALDIVDCHPCVFEWPEYPESWRGFLGGFCDITNYEGDLDVTLDPKHRAVRCRIDW